MKRLRRLARGLTALGHQIGHAVVGEGLTEQTFSLQGNRETGEGVDDIIR